MKGGGEGVGFAGLLAGSRETFCLVAVRFPGNGRGDVPLLRTKQDMLELKMMDNEAEWEFHGRTEGPGEFASITNLIW